jgi:hypothetical protein
LHTAFNIKNLKGSSFPFFLTGKVILPVHVDRNLGAAYRSLPVPILYGLDKLQDKPMAIITDAIDIAHHNNLILQKSFPDAPFRFISWIPGIDWKNVRFDALARKKLYYLLTPHSELTAAELLKAAQEHISRFSSISPVSCISNIGKSYFSATPHLLPDSRFKIYEKIPLTITYTLPSFHGYVPASFHKIPPINAIWPKQFQTYTVEGAINIIQGELSPDECERIYLPLAFRSAFEQLARIPTQENSWWYAPNENSPSGVCLIAEGHEQLLTELWNATKFFSNIASSKEEFEEYWQQERGIFSLPFLSQHQNSSCPRFFGLSLTSSELQNNEENITRLSDFLTTKVLPYDIKLLILDFPAVDAFIGKPQWISPLGRLIQFARKELDLTVWLIVHKKYSENSLRTFVDGSILTISKILYRKREAFHVHVAHPNIPSEMVSWSIQWSVDEQCYHKLKPSRYQCQIPLLQEMVSKGYSENMIAQQLQISIPMIKKLKRQYNIRIYQKHTKRRTGISRQIIRLSQDGKDVKTIARELKIATTYIKKVLGRTPERSTSLPDQSSD